MSARQRGALHLLPTLAVLAGLSLWPAPAAAQNVSASVRGTVTDDAGAVLPAVQVTVRNVATGAAHARVTDASGSYTVPLLPPGEYEVHFALAGFQGVARRGIRLTVGQDAVVSVKLEIGQRSRGTGGGGQRLRSQPDLGRGERAGRRAADPRASPERPLVPAARAPPARRQAALAAGNDVIGGRTPKISINGARPEQNNFLLDGTDINNVYNKTPGSAGGRAPRRGSGAGVPGPHQRLLRRVRPLRRRRDQRGHPLGRQRFPRLRLRVPPQLRARRQELLRPASQPKPDFKRHQFGATLGGPLRKDRRSSSWPTRGCVERLGVTGVTAVPDDNARRGILPGGRSVTLHPGHPGLPRHAVPARQRPIAGRRRRRVPLLRHPAHRRALRPGPHRSPSLAAATPSSAASPTTDGDVDPHPARQAAHLDPAGEARATPTSPSSTSTPSRPRSSTRSASGSTGPSRWRTTIAPSTSRASMSWIPGDPFGYLTIRGWSPRWRATSACRATTG